MHFTNTASSYALTCSSVAFALFYTAVIGSGGLAPIAYGAIADNSNQTVGVLAAAATAALVAPMALGLRPSLRR